MPSTPAPLLVFAHYFGGSARSWNSPLGALDGQFEFVAPSLAGFGGLPSTDDVSLEGYARRFKALAEDRPWIAVGHSMGGKIALKAACMRPKGLIGVILIAASPPTPEPMSEEDRRTTLNDFSDEAAARAHIAKIAPRTLSPAIFEQCVEDEVSVRKDAWRWWLETGSREDISSDTARIDLPVLVISGDRDVVMGDETPRKIAAGLRHANLQIVPGGGHLVPLEQPLEVAALVRAFVAEHAVWGAL